MPNIASDKSAKMLERVRALLAKADGTDFPEEAESFRAKADELMTTYAIEMWQVEAAANGVNQREMPERMDMDFIWYWEGNGTFRQQLWYIFQILAIHCRCKVMSKHANRTVPVLGLPADLRYLDMLFTHLMLDLSNKVDPKPSAKLSYQENLAMLKEAGLGWPEITRRMVDAGLMEYLTTTEPRKRYNGETKEMETVEVPVMKPWEIRKNYAKAAHNYRDWCKREGRPQSYTNPKTYRRNFADGYADVIHTRLSQMRRNQHEAYDKGHEAGGMEVVMRDIRHAINDLMYDLFPETRPHPADCECDKCHAKKCTDRQCKRPKCIEKRKPVRYQEDNRKVDYAARSAGSAAGREVRIAAGNAGQKIGEDRGKLGGGS